MANCLGPDETARYEQSHRDLNCLQRYVLVCRDERVRQPETIQSVNGRLKNNKIRRLPSIFFYQRSQCYLPYLSVNLHVHPFQSSNIFILNNLSHNPRKHAFLHSLISLHYPHAETLHPWLFKMHTVKILIRLCECAS